MPLIFEHIKKRSIDLQGFDEVGFVPSWVCHFGGGTQTTTQNTDPWSGQQPYLTGLFQDAQNQYQNYTPQYYGASGTTLNGQDISGQSTVAALNPAETGAISGIENTGMNGSPAMTAANNSVSNILSGDPAMNQSIAAGVVPGLESQFTQGNSVNNPAMAYATSSGLGNALLQNQLGAATTAQNLYGMGLSGQEAALNAGQAQQAQDQNALTNNVNMFNYQQQLPYNQINQLANLINGQYGMTSTTNSPQQTLFGSLFSDARMKENIKRIGVADNGLSIYSYTYKGDTFSTTHIGFLAQEVEKIHPEAVRKNGDGLLMVNYAKAVLPAKIHDEFGRVA